MGNVIKIYECKKCGGDVETKTNLTNNKILVIPCEKCEQKIYNDGYNDGYDSAMDTWKENPNI